EGVKEVEEAKEDFTLNFVKADGTLIQSVDYENMTQEEIHTLGRELADQYVGEYGNYTQYQVNNVLTFTFEGVEEVDELQDFTINFVKADGTLIQAVDYENMTQEEIHNMGRFLADQYVGEYGNYTQYQV